MPLPVSMRCTRILWIYIMLAVCMLRTHTRALCASLGRRSLGSSSTGGGSGSGSSSSPTPIATPSTPIAPITVTTTPVATAGQIGTIMAKSGLVRQAYTTLTTRPLFAFAHLIIVEAPTPEAFQFPDTTNALANHRVLYSATLDDITTEEVIFGRVKEQTNKARLNKFIGGRIALRRALNAILGGRVVGGADLRPNDSPPPSPPSPPSPGSSSSSLASEAPLPSSAPVPISESGSILRDQWGAPYLHPNITGSISHKDFLCVGAAAADLRGRVGVDLEHCNNKAAAALFRRILTPEEQAHIGSLGRAGLAVQREEEVLLIFSFKEAIYKAIHPFLARSIDFTEVEVFPRPDGQADVVFRLKSNETFEYKASWERYRERYWLTCVHCADPSGLLDPSFKYSVIEGEVGALSQIA